MDRNLHCCRGSLLSAMLTRRMPRRSGGKLLLVLIVAAVLCMILFYEGNILAGDVLRQKLSGYHRALGLSVGLSAGSGASRLSSPSSPLLPPEGPTTPVWRNPVYAERRHRSENVCSKVRQGAVVRLTRYRNVSYCVVPKVGCTFWLNVFRFLHGDTGNKRYHSPFAIPRVITHYGARKSMMYWYTNNTFAPSHLAEDLRFMFVREPYSRLWSAYVDKFLLIDYWRTEGKNIVKLRAKKDNTTRCAGDISFREFVEYVVSRPGGGRVLNEHWKPILHLCSPCLYQPHVIGKMETFSQDSRYVLRLMNSSWILDAYDHQQHVYQEMDMLIEYNFQVLKTKHYVNCSNATDLSRRLWKTFQINGYIPVEKSFPDPGREGINASQFRALAHDAYRNRPAKSPAEWRQQREQAVVDAYRDIPTKTMEKLKKLYQEDFEMYGYDPEPDSLFAHRRKTKEIEKDKEKKEIDSKKAKKS